MAIGKMYRQPKKETTKAVPKAVKRYVARKLDTAIEDKTQIGSMNSIFGSISTTWSHKNFCDIPEGTDSDDRVGRTIKIKELNFRTSLKPSDQYNHVRIVLGLYDGHIAPLTGKGIDSVINKRQMPDTVKHIYMDKLIPLTFNSYDTTTTTEVCPVCKVVSYHKKFKTPITVKYSDETYTYPSQKLVLSMISDSIMSSHPSCVFGSWELVYEDA